MAYCVEGGGPKAEEPRGSSVGGSGDNAFVRSVAAVLERTEYRRCESGEDIEAIRRLRYKAYRANGFVGETPEQMTSDSMDDLPNCYRYGVFIDGELVSTVRVHHITRDEPVGPVMSVFSDILQPKLEQGETFINPSLLAADPEAVQIYRVLPYITLRIALVANTWFDSTACICLIRREHTAFYKRVFLSEPVGEPRAYPPFTVPVMLYSSDCAYAMDKIIARFPFFGSTEMERRMLFAKPAPGELAPLTILPTARYYQMAA